MSQITQKFLHDHFFYRDGFLYKKSDPLKPLGYYRQRQGDYYFIITTEDGHRQSVTAHRMIYLYHHGYIPECVFHINEDSRDNRIENLTAGSKEELYQKLKAKNIAAAETRKKEKKVRRRHYKKQPVFVRILVEGKEIFSNTYESKEEAEKMIQIDYFQKL